MTAHKIKLRDFIDEEFSSQLAASAGHGYSKSLAVLVGFNDDGSVFTTFAVKSGGCLLLQTGSIHRAIDAYNAI